MSVRPFGVNPMRPIARAIGSKIFLIRPRASLEIVIAGSARHAQDGALPRGELGERLPAQSAHRLAALATRLDDARRAEPAEMPRHQRLRQAHVGDQLRDGGVAMSEPARPILRDPGEAQDATHDAFVQAWRKWDTLRDASRFEPWFDRILVNTCRNRLRSRRWQATDISAEIALATGDHAAGAADRDVIGVALARLSPDQQVVVALRYYRDLTVDEIARRLDIPRG